MDRERAKEIVDSGKLAYVTYKGVPIYIQHVDEHANTARIYPLDEPTKEEDVPLDQLIEH